MKTAVIYARYSSDKQTEQSIEGQLRVCNEFAEKHDIVIVDTYIDRAMTGTNDNRTSFQKMLKDSVKRAWDIVLVYKLDRFSRNKYETAMHKKTLKDNGIKLISAMENIPDTPEGIILESLLEGMAEYYSAELSQKVKRGQNESRQKGQFTGGVMVYGYKNVNKKVQIDEDQAVIVRMIYEKFAAGVYVKDILKELNDMGILNHGKPFAKNTLYHVLHNEKYVGILRHGDEVFTNIYPQIVPTNIFEIVKRKCDENKLGKHQNDVVYLLKNKVWCGYCGKTIASESGTCKNGVVKRYYKCTNRKKNAACDKLPIRKELFEQIVIDTTMKLFDNQDNLNLIADRILLTHNKRLVDDSKLSILAKEKMEYQKSIDNLISCMEKGIVTNSTKKRLEDLELIVEQIDEKMAIEKTKQKVQITRDDIFKFIKTALKKSPQLMIKLLVKNIILYDDKMEITYNYVDKKYLDDNEHKPFELKTENFETTINNTKFNQPPTKIELEIKSYI